MRLIERSHCVQGDEFGVELALREALGNAVARQSRRSRNKSTRSLSLRARQRNIHRRDGSRKGFDFRKRVDNGLASDSAAGHGHGIQLMKAYMHEVHFERSGSEVHIRQRSRTTPCS